MPTQDQLEIIKPNGDLEFRTLNPNKGIVNIGRAPQNDVVINGPGIRPFHAFLDYRQRPARFVILNSDSSFPANGPQVSPNPGTLELGGYILVFLEGNSATTTPSPGPNSPAIFTELSAAEWVIGVEETAVADLTIANEGNYAAEFAVDVVDLDQSWAAVSPAKVYLKPGERQVVTIAITPPKTSGSRAGTHRFMVRVASSGYPGQESLHQAALTINPFYDFAVSQLSPKRQTLSWSGLSAQYNISVTNKGNSDTLFQLTGADEESACKFEFQLPDESNGLTGQVELFMLPNEQVSIPIQTSTRINPVIGFGKQIHRFTISVAAAQGEQMSRSVLGELARKPLFGSGMMLMMAVALVALSIFAVGRILENAPVNMSLITLVKPNSSDKPERLLFDLPAQITPVPSVEQTLTEENEQLAYEEMFKAVASEHNLSWRVLEALAYRESRMNYLAVGKAGDMGLMQVIPSTWDEWAPKTNVDANAPFDPYTNIQVGAAYLAYVRDFCAKRGYTGSEWMLIAYNWGPGRLGKFWDNGGVWGEIPATQRKYAITILNTAADRAFNPTAFDKIYAEVAATAITE